MVCLHNLTTEGCVMWSDTTVLAPPHPFRMTSSSLLLLLLCLHWPFEVLGVCLFVFVVWWFCFSHSNVCNRISFCLCNQAGQEKASAVILGTACGHGGIDRSRPSRHSHIFSVRGVIMGNVVHCPEPTQLCWILTQGMPQGIFPVVSVRMQTEIMKLHFLSRNCAKGQAFISNFHC